MGSFRAASLIVALALCGSSCAAAPAAEGPSAAPVPGGRTAVLLAKEMEASTVRDGLLLDAIRYLRPAYLVARGGGDRGGTVPEVQVSINDGPPGPLSLIEDLRVRAVASVALLTPAEVSFRFGMRDSMGPVLLIKLKQ